MELTEARKLAAQYQSPGPVGRTFASFASGCSVSYEDFMAECDMTSQEIGFEAHEDMAALREFAGETEEEIWTDHSEEDEDCASCGAEAGEPCAWDCIGMAAHQEAGN